MTDPRRVLGLWTRGLRTRGPRLFGALLLILPPLLHPSVATGGSAGALTTNVVVDAGAGAQLTQLVAAQDDLYVIDAGPFHVRRYILNGLAYAELFTQVMRWKEEDHNLIMGQPLDLFLTGERLLILDSLGSLWSYFGPNYGRLLVPLRLQRNQGTPVAVALHGADLFLLDPQQRQVWDYAPDATGGYDTVPRPLLPRPLTALSQGIRLAVTGEALLVLCASGVIIAIPWARPSAARCLCAAIRATGVWGSDARTRFFVSSARQVALSGLDGRIVWRASVPGLNGEVLRDVAYSPTGRLYVLTPTRILHVAGAIPAP